MNPSRGRVVNYTRKARAAADLIQICHAKLFQATYHLVQHMRGSAFETGLGKQNNSENGFWKRIHVILNQKSNSGFPKETELLIC